MYYGQRSSIVEIAFDSSQTYAEPDRVDVWATFRGPSRETEARSWRVPAYWAGGSAWKVRFAGPSAGRFSFETECSDQGNRDLHGVRGELEVAEYDGANPLLQHGRLRVSADHRHLEHADGVPFLWLADTWWMGQSRRFGFPDEYRALAADRVSKGFSVVQTVVGFPPDQNAFDPRGEGDGGFPTSRDYATVNPAYFDAADLRIAYLVGVGLVPCILAGWGYYLTWAGEANMKRFWRYLVARYGAYPVVWCLAGEATMPYYLSMDKEGDARRLRRGWTEVAASVRALDPFRNLVTIHPTRFGRDQVEDDSLLDFDMLQTGHSGYPSVADTARYVAEALARQPRLPVLVGEVNYEGIFGSSWEDIQRLCFWIPMLLGACGHTYGANGIWQVNQTEQPFGPSPHGRSWGSTPWDEAMALPGSRQLGLGKRFLERFPWWRALPHPEWVESPATPRDPLGPYAAGAPREFRVIYVPRLWNPPLVRGIEPEVAYSARYFDPRSGREIDLGPVSADSAGDWRPPLPPVVQDWVLALTVS